MSTEETRVSVTRQFKRRGDVVSVNDTDSTIDVRKYETATASVRIDLRQTVNMGDYESIAVGVSVEVPCYFEEVHDAKAFAKQFAETTLMAEVEEIKSFASKRDSKHPF